MKDSYTKELQAAIRRRLVRELEKEQSPASIVNNLYGGGGEKQSGGIQDSMLSGEDPFDYYVDINRKSDPNDPKGWIKQVHRHRGKKE